MAYENLQVMPELDPNKEYTIEELVDYIRNAMTGKNVREALARSVEATNEIATWARDVAQGLIDGAFDAGELATMIESKLNQLEQDYAPKLTSIETEIEDARGGVTNLGDRLNEFSSQLAQTAKGFLGVPLSYVASETITKSYTGVFPLNYHDGWLYGFRNNNTIVRSNNNGETWTAMANNVTGSIHSILFCDDGEVLISNGTRVLKSDGWGGSPSSVTWASKLEKSKSTGVGIVPLGMDGDGSKFIVNEYSSSSDRSESRYIWISTDMGNTFNIVYDTYITDPEHTSHMHGVCYDKWADRFFVSHGHGVLTGVYYSDDDGVTWHKVGGNFQPSPSPTTLTATDNGIVCGSDSGDAGLYGIPRTANPQDMRMIRTARWEVNRPGVTGLAYRTFRDDKTGHVYVGFQSEYDGISPVIMAGTATTGSTVWKSEDNGYIDLLYLAVTDDKIFGVTRRGSDHELIEADKPKIGVNSFDKGNIQTGKSKVSTGIAIGTDTVVEGHNQISIGNKANSKKATGAVTLGANTVAGNQSLAIGYNAEAVNVDSISIGYGAKSDAFEAIAIGKDSMPAKNSTRSIAIGTETETQQYGISIGYRAKNRVGATHAINIGTNAKTGELGIAIGRNAESGNQSIAFGAYAKSNHANSIALGDNTETTLANQVQIGNKHMELALIDDVPVGVASDAGRIFLINVDGVTQLCARIGGKTTVLATN